MISLEEVFVNLTDHDVDIVVGDQETKIKIPKSGQSLRLAEAVQEDHSLYGVPAIRKSYSLPLLPPPRWVVDRQCTCELPNPAPGEGACCQCGFSYKAPVYYIVSLPMFQAVASVHPGRRDFVCPDTGPQSAIRDKDGRIVGVKRLMCM